MKDNDSLCLYPWLHLQISPDDIILPCCKFNNGRLNPENLITVDTWNKDVFRDIRKKMLAGEKLEQCLHCYSLEKSNVISMRQTANRDYNLKDRELTEEFEAIEFIEIGLDNICNFQCRMCSSRFSSSLKSRDVFFSSIINGYSKNNKVEKTNKRLDKIKKLNVDWSKLKNVKIIGGEPFMSPSFEPLLDFLLEVANIKECSLSIATNCSHKLSNEIYDKLNQFKRIRITGSFDSIYEWNDYQRIGSNFQRDLDNFLEYGSKITRIKPQVNSVFTVQILNSFNIFDEWWTKHYPDIYVSIDAVQYNAFSPHYFPDWYHEWIDNIINYSTKRGNQIQSILLDKRGYDPKYYNQYHKQQEAFDVYYGTDIEDINPEFVNLLRKYS